MREVLWAQDVVLSKRGVFALETNKTTFYMAFQRLIQEIGRALSSRTQSEVVSRCYVAMALATTITIPDQHLGPIVEALESQITSFQLSRAPWASAGLSQLRKQANGQSPEKRLLPFPLGVAQVLFHLKDARDCLGIDPGPGFFFIGELIHAIEIPEQEISTVILGIEQAIRNLGLEKSAPAKKILFDLEHRHSKASNRDLKVTSFDLGGTRGLPI